VNLLSQTRKETASVLVAVKRQIRVLNFEFDDRLQRSNSQTSVIIDELINKVS
jgi:hypothetical protein